MRAPAAADLFRDASGIHPTLAVTARASSFLACPGMNADHDDIC